MFEVDDFQGYHYLHLIRKYFAEHSNLRALVKSQVMCGCSLLPMHGEQRAVYVLSNGQSSVFIGNSSCKNAWTCPKCAIRKARNACMKIAGTIDYFERQGVVPVMMTLTVPHSVNVDVRITVAALYSAWRKFLNRFSSRRKLKGGEPFGRFRQELDIKHWFFAAEATWGTHGWHPHFHILLFVPRRNLKYVASWEGRLRANWFRKVLMALGEEWRNCEVDEGKIQFLLHRIVEQRNSVSKPLFFSKDKLGKVVPIPAHAYISGLTSGREGAAMEMSALHLKTAKQGHLTSWQVLEQASKCDAEQDAEGFELWMSRYADLMIATKYRTRFKSSPSLMKLAKSEIVKYINDVVRAKETKFKCVTWFRAGEWVAISYAERSASVFATIGRLAVEAGEQAIFDYLRTLDIILEPRPANRFVEVVELAANGAVDDDYLKIA